MPRRCCIRGCTTKAGEGVQFFAFTKDILMREKWVEVIQNAVDPEFTPSLSSAICKLHFEQEHFLDYDHKHLKPSAVPSVFARSVRRSLFQQDCLAPSTSASSSQEPDHIVVANPAVVLQSEISEDQLMVTELVTSTPIKGESCSSSAACHEKASVERILNKRTNSSLEEDCQVIEPVFSAVTFSSESTEPMPLNTQAADEDALSDQEVGLDDSLLNVDATTPTRSALKQKNKELLTKVASTEFRLSRFVNDDSKIRYYTGFATYQHLHCFFTFLTPACYFLCYVGSKNAKKNSDTSYEEYVKCGKKRQLPAIDEFFMTLVRLRLGLGETLLGDLFGVTQSCVSRIVNTWILFMYDRVSKLPIWPTPTHAKASAPKFFSEQFPDCIAILDGTEFFLQKPTAAFAQKETFSSYKHHNTAKIVYGIMPNGQVSFISPLYAGRCSDKKIFRHCGLLDKIPAGSAIMVDRGFDIEKDCNDRNIKLYIPAFKAGRSQFSEQELKESRDIASCRIHVERAIRWLKEFSLLSGEIPITLCPILEQTVVVCAHLSNFSTNIIKDK